MYSTRFAFSVWRLEGGWLVPVMAGAGSDGVSLARLPRVAPLLQAGKLVRSRGAKTDGEVYAELAAPGSSRRGPRSPRPAPGGGREPIGVLGVTRHGPSRYRPEEVSAAQGLASHVAVALANVALFQRAQAVAAAETRQAIARDLHDWCPRPCSR